MLHQVFYDDCNWDDHVGIINREFGVTGVRTPNGLTEELFCQGLKEWQRQRLAVQET